MSVRDTYTPDSVCNRCGEHYARRVGHSCADITKLFSSLQRVSEEDLIKRKEILQLLNSLRSAIDNECKSYCDYYGEGCGYSSDRLEATEEILKRLIGMWGEQ